MNFSCGNNRKRTVLVQIVAGSFSELKFGILDGPGPAIKFLFWKQGERTILVQILAGSLLDFKFGILAGPGPAIEFLLR